MFVDAVMNSSQATQPQEQEQVGSDTTSGRANLIESEINGVIVRVGPGLDVAALVAVIRAVDFGKEATARPRWARDRGSGSVLRSGVRVPRQVRGLDLA